MIDERKLIESFRSCLNTGKESFPIDLIIEIIEEQNKVECSNCSRRSWYQRGYEDGLNANKLK